MYFVMFQFLIVCKVHIVLYIEIYWDCNLSLEEALRVLKIKLVCQTFVCTVIGMSTQKLVPLN